MTSQDEPAMQPNVLLLLCHLGPRFRDRRRVAALALLPPEAAELQPGADPAAKVQGGFGPLTDLPPHYVEGANDVGHGAARDRLASHPRARPLRMSAHRQEGCRCLEGA